MDQKFSAISHPSLFQRPAADATLDARPILVSATNPDKIWREREGSEVPMTPAEKARLIKCIVPAIRLRGGAGMSNLLLHSFMSRQNAEVIHTIVRKLVLDYSGHAIGRQSDQEVTGLMFTVYKAHAVEVNEESTARTDLILHVRREIQRLNTIVAQTAVPAIINAVEQHVAFLSAVDKPTSEMALDRPKNTNSKGDKAL